MGKSIVLVSGLQLFPPQSGGQLRSYNLCKALAKKGHNVSIYSFTGRKADYLQGVHSFERQGVGEISEHVNMSKVYGLLQFISYKIGLPPFWLSFIASFYIPKMLKEKIKTADMVIVDFPFLYSIFRICPGQKVLNTHNAEYELCASSLLSRLVRWIEIRAMNLAELTIFCCSSDMDKFNGFPNKACIIPNGLDLDCFEPSNVDAASVREELGISQDKKIVLFTGSSYGPNKAGFNALLEWCKANTEFIRANHLLFLVVGSVSQPYQYEDVFKALGRVDSVQKYLLAADLAINPVSSGSGANVKVAEYIAARLPVLSTEFGIRGFELNSKSSFLFDFGNLSSCLLSALNVGDLQEYTIKAYTDNLQNICMYSGVCKVDDL